MTKEEAIEVLKERIQRKRFSRTFLAEQLGVSKGTITKALSEDGMNYKTLCRLFLLVTGKTLEPQPVQYKVGDKVQEPLK